MKSSPETNKVHRRLVRIEWGDCDAAGIVFFPRYLAMFDTSTQMAFEAAGLPFRQLVQDYSIVGFPVVDLHTRFIASSTFGEEVAIDTSIYEWGRSSFKVLHRLYKASAGKPELLAVEGREVRVWTARDPISHSLKSTAIPREVMARFDSPEAS